jgi:aminoglycoside phosphotransferase family enzyme/predicted kinase
MTATRDSAGAAPALDVGGPTELCATHASWVYLARDEVWKLKRPVDLGFLDFRTVESRRRCCEEEARLNRRLAPDVYLGVEPVRRGARGLTVRGDGPVVDWAVHMRRLPDDGCATALLARGRLDADHLARLARRLATFHSAAYEMPAAGEVATLRANVDENFASTERFVGDLLDQATLEGVRAFQLGWLAAHGARLHGRVAAGRVREGHGDLRLEHVYFPSSGPDAEPVVIDCLEFSERLRCGDVAADAAFLAMELDAAGRPDLAAGFLARFAEASDDFGIYAVIDFYLSYRAWVRGKVAALLAVDPAAPPATRAEKRREAQARFALALTYARREAARPFVVAVAGLPGSGKSTLAAALGSALALPVVSSDLTRKALAGLAPTARGPAELYSDASRDRTYDELLGRGGDVLGAGRSVILDATFSTRAWRAAAAALARQHGARFVLVERDEPPAVLRERLSHRRGQPTVSDATDAELEQLASRYERPTAQEGFSLLSVRGEDALSLALSCLENEGLSSLGPPRPDGS